MSVTLIALEVFPGLLGPAGARVCSLAKGVIAPAGVGVYNTDSPFYSCGVMPKGLNNGTWFAVRLFRSNSCIADVVILFLGLPKKAKKTDARTKNEEIPFPLYRLRLYNTSKKRHSLLSIYALLKVRLYLRLSASLGLSTTSRGFI